jgi:hypothetical protein
VVVTAVDNVCSKAEYLLLVADGDEPTPAPPDVDPIPGPVAKLVVLYETGNRTTGQARVMLGLRAWSMETETYLPILDQNVPNATGKPSPWLAPMVKAQVASGLKLPVIVVNRATAGGEDSFVVEPLPETTAEAVALIEKLGG